MDRIRIIGGERLEGTIPISGAKNAALPLMIASLLTNETLTLHGMPRLADVSLLGRILGNHGVDITIAGKRAGQNTSDGQTYKLTAAEIVDTTAPYEMVARMRASFWVLAPLLARCGEAKVSLPGGCAIGTRPVDLHLVALEALGADIELDAGYVIAKAPKGLKGARIHLGKVSVGATHNALMAAVLADGDSEIVNAAREPEVGDLATCLVEMGAKIEGIGTSTGPGRAVPSAGPSITCCRTGSRRAPARHGRGDHRRRCVPERRARRTAEALEALLRTTGVDVYEEQGGLRVARNGHGLEPVSVETP